MATLQIDPRTGLPIIPREWLTVTQDPQWWNESTGQMEQGQRRIGFTPEAQQLLGGQRDGFNYGGNYDWQFNVTGDPNAYTGDPVLESVLRKSAEREGTRFAYSLDENGNYVPGEVLGTETMYTNNGDMNKKALIAAASLVAGGLGANALMTGSMFTAAPAVGMGNLGVNGLLGTALTDGAIGAAGGAGAATGAGMTPLQSLYYETPFNMSTLASTDAQLLGGLGGGVNGALDASVAALGPSAASALGSTAAGAGAAAGGAGAGAAASGLVSTLTGLGIPEGLAKAIVGLGPAVLAGVAGNEGPTTTQSQGSPAQQGARDAIANAVTQRLPEYMARDRQRADQQMTWANAAVGVPQQYGLPAAIDIAGMAPPPSVFGGQGMMGNFTPPPVVGRRGLWS